MSAAPQDAAVTGGHYGGNLGFDAKGNPILSREEKIEYRDEYGNLLDPEQVKALEGKVSFQTKYETRTRLVDAEGKEVSMIVDDIPQQPMADGHVPEGVAPSHPDVDGADPQTAISNDAAMDVDAAMRSLAGGETASSPAVVEVEAAEATAAGEVVSSMDPQPAIEMDAPSETGLQS